MLGFVETGQLFSTKFSSHLPGQRLHAIHVYTLFVRSPVCALLKKWFSVSVLVLTLLVLTLLYLIKYIL